MQQFMTYSLLDNQDLIHGIYGGDTELAIETLNEFVDSIDLEMESLNSFLISDNTDWEEVYKILHKLKPSLYYIGMDKDYQAMNYFLQPLSTGNVDQILAEKIRNHYIELKQSIEEVKAYRASL